MAVPERLAVVHDAAEVVVGPNRDGSLDRREDAAVAVVDGRVAAVGPTDDVVREYPPENADAAVDASGRSVVPGFVDSHTHALFAGDRSDEFEAKLRGATYQEILAEGGGILRTVRATREADDETLLANLLDHLDTMLAHGTTTAEVKSGYGLDAETELRMLEVIAEADDRHPVDVVPTFMGAHAVPEGADSDDYVERVVTEQLPAVAEQGVAEFCDVFCEEDVFSVEQSRRVLEAGREHGLTPKVHAEEFTRLGGAQLAAEVGAASADHLLHADDADARALADAGVTPVFLPGTAFSLGAGYADPRPYLEAGAPVAVATDFNPNCYSQSMQFAVALACVGMELTPAEALVAATSGGAHALARDGDAGDGGTGGSDVAGPRGGAGTLFEGAPGDLVVLDAPTHVHVPYNFGVNVAETVVADGEVVHRA
jgi:imidazolonepropionase